MNAAVGINGLFEMNAALLLTRLILQIRNDVTSVFEEFASFCAAFFVVFYFFLRHTLPKHHKKIV